MLLVPAPLRWLLSRFLRCSVPTPQGGGQLRSARDPPDPRLGDDLSQPDLAVTPEMGVIGALVEE